MIRMSDHPAPHPDGLRLRVLSLNIQVGLLTQNYRHYVTRAWRHVLPSRHARENLKRVAALAADYDLVALQEADAGSLRTRQVNQVAHLAELAGFPYWHAAVTRDLAPFAQHCLGCLSRQPLQSTHFHPLPGRLPGRGVLEISLQPAGHEPLRLLIAHLALSRGVRAQQLDFLAGLVRPGVDTVLMGDLNCEHGELDARPSLTRAGLQALHEAHTFPSWAPSKSLDHMLATPGVTVLSTRVLDERLSDHLPVATELCLRLSAAPAAAASVPPARS